MQILDFPPLDRSRIAAMVDGRKAALGACWSRDPDAAVALVVAFFAHLAPTAAAAFGGREPALLLGVCTLRHHRTGDAERAPWHTDARFFPPDGVGLTFWCPADLVGPGVPGVEFRDGSVPAIGPGHALVIPPDVEHRTQPIDGERLSFEARCSPVDRIPVNVGPAPIATRRRRGAETGVLIEA